MEGDKLRIAVVSDLHFVNKDKVGDTEKHSWLTFSASNSSPNNFWDSLIEKIKQDGIKADLLICPGDITTHAEPTALEFAWGKLNELAKILDCKILATATGNHDVISRLSSSSSNPVRDLNSIVGIVENLKKLSPPYPLVDLSDKNNINAHQNRVNYFGSDYLIYD